VRSVPIGWKATKLRDVVQLRTGPFGSSLHRSDYVEDGIPIVNPMHINNGHIQASSKHGVSEGTAARLRDFQLRVGDIVLGRRGEMGRCAVVGEKQSGWLCGTGSIVITAHSGIQPDYLQRLLSSDAVIKNLTNESVGSTMVNLNQQILLDLDLAVPPRNEQTRIVEKIEELLSDLDAGVAELKAAQRKLAQYRQSLLKAAVEGALTAEWRVARAKAGEPQETGAELLQRILTERRIRWETRQLAKFAEQGKTPPKDWKTKYPEPIAPDTTNLPELPESWVWASVEQLGAVQLGRQRSPDKMKGVCPVQYIRAANITEQGINFNDVLEMDFSETEIATFKLNAGDVLLTEASGSPQHVGRPVVWPKVDGVYCFQNTVIRFVPRGIDSNYAFCIFQAWQKLGVFQKLSGGVGINHLSAGKFLTVPVPLPSREEQNAIVDSVAAAVVLVDEQGLAIEHSLKQATAQRKNILKAAFAGQLVPQDPNDEPASVLLERIRANRTSNAAPKLRGGKTRKSA